MGSLIHRILFKHAPPAAGAAAAWSPTDLGASLLVWYKGDAGVLTDVDGVHTWEDQSGNGRDATQATGSKKPQLQSAHINGIDAVTFDGVDDQLKATIPATSQPYTYAACGKLEVIHTADKYIVSTYATGGIWATRGNPGDFRMWATTWTNNGTATDTNANGWVVLFNGASSYIRQRGVEVQGTGNPGANATSTTLSLSGWNGAGALANVSFLDVLLISGAVTGDDLTNLESYFATRGGF